jgi:UDP-N-acetylmuramate: L-alanyl-gamma-D-glutamyl-meso-diaminopimelate ligase
LVGEVAGVRVYDDFAHHPTAVAETIRALRGRHPEGRFFVVFEPRSATACRALHQNEYGAAFRGASHVIIAPLGRTNIAEAERLDVPRLVDSIARGGTPAEAPPDVDSIVARLAAEAKSGDTIALLSNGAFGGIHQKLVDALQRN